MGIEKYYKLLVYSWQINISQLFWNLIKYYNLYK